MTIEEYFRDWLKVIDRTELLKVTKEITSIYKKKQCEPAYSNIFKAFHVTPYSKLKMVWLSQDPYFQSKKATGIAFANSKETKTLSPSLQLLKESVINFEVPHNLVTFDSSLEEWSKQGILLLNSALTVEVNNPGSHTVIWRDFIKSLLGNLSANNTGLIYVLWGKTAQTFTEYIGPYNIVYKMPHPAYYARMNSKIPHTFFVQLNNTLYSYFKEKIEWYKEEC